MTHRNDNEPRVIDLLDLPEAVRNGSAEGATIDLGNGTRIENYGFGFAKGLASIWGLGHLVGSRLVVDPDYVPPTPHEDMKAIWDQVGRYLWSALPPLEELERDRRNV